MVSEYQSEVATSSRKNRSRDRGEDVRQEAASAPTSTHTTMH